MRAESLRVLTWYEYWYIVNQLIELIITTRQISISACQDPQQTWESRNGLTMTQVSPDSLSVGVS